MKKTIFILFAVLALASCKNNAESGKAMPDNSEETQTDNSTVSVNLPVYRGEFYYSDDAAVFSGKNFIYGVKRDSMAEVLAAKVAPVKQDEYDMVPVVVQGILEKKEEGAEGWDEILTIKNIITVSTKPAKVDIKIEEKQ